MVPVLIAVVLAFSRPSVAAGDTEQRFRALSFGRTTSDYVQFQPDDMSPFQSSFTACMWMKRAHDASNPIVLHYHPSDEIMIIIGSNGYWNSVNKGFQLTGKFPELGEWFHYAMSWVSGGTQRVYINGVEIGSTYAASSNLRLGGNIALGINEQSTKYTKYIFGGQLHKLNMFSEKLSAYQIREMSEAGMCSVVEEKYATRKLKWEQILTERRYGNVTEFSPESCLPDHIKYLEARLNKTESELGLTNSRLLDTEIKLNSTDHQLQTVSTALNSTVKDLTDTETQLNKTQTELAEKNSRLKETETKLKSTLKELLTVSTTLNHTQSLLEDARRLETVSRWDVLFTSPYLNKLFTTELYDQLVNSWDMMEKFIGVNITEGLVQHFKDHHEECENCEDDYDKNGHL